LPQQFPVAWLLPTKAAEQICEVTSHKILRSAIPWFGALKRLRPANRKTRQATSAHLSACMPTLIIQLTNNSLIHRFAMRWRDIDGFSRHSRGRRAQIHAPLPGRTTQKLTCPPALKHHEPNLLVHGLHHDPRSQRYPHLDVAVVLPHQMTCLSILTASSSSAGWMFPRLLGYNRQGQCVCTHGRSRLEIS
jgi:hypothetical protein